MKFTRILSLCLALLTVVALLASCNKEEEPTPEEPVAPTETTLNVITEGITEYVIVRDYKASNAVVDAVNNVVDSIKLNIGADITIKECYNDLTEEEAENDVPAPKEILIGMTNRQESIDALSNLRSKDYTISVHGEKLVIGGIGEEGTITAITKFLNDFVAEQGNRFAVRQGIMQNLVMSTANDVNFTAKYSYTTVAMAGVRIDSFGMVYPKYSDNSEECRLFASELSTYIANQTGYALTPYKGSGRWYDYEILVGDLSADNDSRIPVTDHCVCEDLENGEYLIKLVQTEVTYEDGSKHEGAQLFICFSGAAGKAAAFDAFKSKIMPINTEAVPFNMDIGFTLTNRAGA